MTGTFCMAALFGKLAPAKPPAEPGAGGGTLRPRWSASGAAELCGRPGRRIGATAPGFAGGFFAPEVAPLVGSALQRVEEPGHCEVRKGETGDQQAEQQQHQGGDEQAVA